MVRLLPHLSHRLLRPCQIHTHAYVHACTHANQLAMLPQASRHRHTRNYTNTHTQSVEVFTQSRHVWYCRGVRNAAKSRTRFRIFTDSPEIQGFRGIQSRFTKIPRDSCRFAEIRWDSPKIQWDSLEIQWDSLEIQ